MLKKDVAKKWHVPKKVVDDLVKTGELKSSLVRGYRNQKRIDVAIEEVERFEKLKNIPSDPISFQELGFTPKEMASLKLTGKIKNYASLTRRIKVYSKSEFKALALEELKKAERFKKLL